MTTDASPIRVLHVDDEPDFAEVAAEFIERRDNRITIETALSATDGLDRLSDAQYDCVVSDFEMPGQDGIEFLEAVREEYPDLPFILYTGKGSEEVASDAITAGATDYLQKEGGIEQYTILANRIENAVQQRRDRAARLETERRLTELTEHSPDVFWMFTADWEECLFVNDAFADLYGQSLETLRSSGWNALEAVHPDDRERVEGAMNRLAAGQDIDVEHRVNAAEDYQQWVWVRGVPITNDTGAVQRLAGFTREVTDRKEREEDVRGDESILREVLEASPNAVLVVDMEGVIRQSNRTVREVLGYAPDELEGMVVEDLLLEEDRPQHVEFRDGYMDSPEPRPMGRELDLYALSKSGEEVPVEISLGPIRDDGDRYVVATIADVSKRKKRERELQRQNERLDEFASVVSHDLRNPLAVIEGRVELARENHESEDLAAISRAADRMNELIDGLLTLAREGDEVGDPEPIDLDEIASICWQNVSTGGASLKSEAGQTVIADRNRIQQLFENLFRNAIEHGGSGVTITVGGLADGAGFYVADDGPGIPDDQVEQVFEAGYSVSENGSGFGLSIAEQIAKTHGWDLSLVESRRGGARFEFRTE